MGTDKTVHVSIRLPESVVGAVKREAEKLRVPYQSLLRTFILEGLAARQGASPLPEDMARAVEALVVKVITAKLSEAPTEPRKEVLQLVPSITPPETPLPLPPKVPRGAKPLPPKAVEVDPSVPAQSLGEDIADVLSLLPD